MTTPSETTRHQALSVSTGNNGREDGDGDFDFLTQQPGYKRHGKSFLLIFRICMVAVLLLLFILLIVDLTRRNGGGGDDGDDDQMSLEDSGCLYAVGGGATELGGNFMQPKILSKRCIAVLEEYFKEGGQYYRETKEAIDDAKVIFQEDGDYQSMVILDIDETSLSNVPFALRTHFNATDEERHEWNNAGKAPAIEATLDFYRELRSRGFSVAFVTGRSERNRKATERNLMQQGFGEECRRNPAEDGHLCYFELVMRENDDNRDAVIYKGAERRRLEKEEGFQIVASIGDQWSDLVGKSRPEVIIKMPNPFYYLP